MQTPDKTTGFLAEARADAATLHQSIEQGISQGEARMHAALQQSSARARDLAQTLKTKGETADTSIKAKLMAAAAHADAVAKNGQSGRPRPMLDEAQKLNHRISDAVAHVRTHGGTGAQK
jgi:hypothetical protein